MKTKLSILFLLSLLFTSCGVFLPAKGPEVISIQVLNEQQEPLKNIIVKELYKTPEVKMEFNNSINGTIALPMYLQNTEIYIGSPEYEGTIIYATDTIIILKSVKYRQ